MCVCVGGDGMKMDRLVHYGKADVSCLSLVFLARLSFCIFPISACVRSLVLTIVPFDRPICSFSHGVRFFTVNLQSPFPLRYLRKNLLFCSASAPDLLSCLCRVMILFVTHTYWSTLAQCVYRKYISS